jgi:hypothetical protein
MLKFVLFRLRAIGDKLAKRVHALGARLELRGWRYAPAEAEPVALCPATN